MKDYREYGQTEWFKELSRMQNRQGRINDMESYSLEDYYTIKEPRVKSVKIGGKPQTIPHDKVLAMRDEGKSQKAIALELNAKVKTIQKILSRKWKPKVTSD